MIRELPSLNGLRTFESAARLGSFTEAARELRVTHGAVSRAVAALEAWLEVALFVREGKRLSVTPAGRVFQLEIGAGLDRLATATSRVIAQRSVAVLRVEALPTLAMQWLIPRLPRFQLRHPSVELRLVTSERTIHANTDGYDVAIRRGPERWSGLLATRFLDERATPVCAPGLLRKRRLRAPEDLAQFTWLEADSRPGAWTDWLRAQHCPGVKPARTQRFDHFYLTLQAARDGLGIALGPLPILDGELASGTLIAPLAALTVPSRSYYALTRRGQTPAAVAAFVSWLEDEGRGPTDGSDAGRVQKPRVAATKDS